MAAKYDPDAEAEVLSWFKQLFNVDLEPGMREMEHQLRDGQLLVRYHPSILVIIISNTAAAAAAASDRLQPSITAVSQPVSRLPATRNSHAYSRVGTSTVPFAARPALRRPQIRRRFSTPNDGR